MHKEFSDGFLPHIDDDPIMRLYAHYFLHSEFILECAKDIERKTRKNKTSKVKSDTACKYSSLMTQWLATLYVVVDGFDEIKIEEELFMRPKTINGKPSGFQEITDKSNYIKSIYCIHKDDLRIFRNGVFHFQKNSSKLTQLFDANRGIILWAEDLHAQFRDFFSEYRIVCSVYCAINGRREEAWGPPRYVEW